MQKKGGSLRAYGDFFESKRRFASGGDHGQHMRGWRRIAQLLVLSFAASFIGSATAQPTPDDEAPPERLRQFLEERAQTRPRFAPPPLGAPPERISEARVDWAGLRALVEETRQRDARAGQSAREAISQAAAGVRFADAANLPRVRLPEISRVLLPILVPSDPAVTNSVVVYGQPDAYTATADLDDGVALRISGSRKKLVLPSRSDARERVRRLRENRPTLPSLETTYIITRSESSMDLSFSRFGAGYALSLMCDEPDTDARCAEDAFIVSLASSLAVLNEAASTDVEGADDE